MKFEVGTKPFADALNRLVPFAKEPNVAARVEASDASVHISVLSKQRGVFAKVSLPGVIVDSDGVAYVDFNRLTLTTKLAKASISFKTTSNALVVRSGSVTLNVNLSEQTPEPAIPDCALRYRVEGKEFASKIKQLVSIARTARQSPILEGVYLEEDGKQLQLVATNGNALYLAKCNATVYQEGMKFSEEDSTIVPAFLMNAILSSIKTTEEVAIGRSETAFIVGQPGFIAFGTLQIGKYPPWRRVVDTDAQPQIECRFLNIKEKLEAARLFYQSSSFGAIRIESKGDDLILNASNETSSFKDSFKATKNSDGFNAFCYFDALFSQWFDMQIDAPDEAIAKITFIADNEKSKKIRFDVDDRTEVIMALSGTKYEK